VLSGNGPPDRLAAWVDSLQRVHAATRTLRVDAVADLKTVRPLCDRAGIGVATAGTGTPPCDVLVLARADALPTPGSLRRLVETAHRTSLPWETRLLPSAATAAEADAEPERTPSSCVALPGAEARHVPVDATIEHVLAAANTRGVEVRVLDSAAVLTSVAARPPGTPSEGGRPHAVDGHPAALPATSLHQVLLRAGLPPPSSRASDERPFLTVVTRTQGRRLVMLEEALTCLAAQSVRDFELVVVCHRAQSEAARGVSEVIDSLPTWLRDVTRVVKVERPGRAAPLNDAFALARGRYVAVLDDDDTVTPDWVAAFAELEVRHAGTVLRTSALRQDVEPVPTGPGDEVVPHEVGPAHPGWPRHFDLIAHLWDNATPFMTLAFPRGVHTDLGLRFDESLDAIEDWDYLLRAATLVGVASSPRLTAVYRIWTRAEGSREVHDDAVWDAARSSVVANLDVVPLVLPPGSVEEIRALHRALREEQGEKFHFAGLNERAAADLRTVNEAVVVLRDRIAELEERLARIKRRRQAD
jgi:hypothetical protein